jgi:transposase
VRAVPLLEAGLERLWCDAVAGNRACSRGNLHAWLAEREIKAAILRRKDELDPIAYDAGQYRKRNTVERLINHLRRLRAVGTRSDRLTASYRAIVIILLSWSGSSFTDRP